MVQVVLPNDANPLGFILGGTVMHLIDIAGAIACFRHTRQRVVTAAVDGLQFLHPIKVGDLILLKAQVTATFRTSLEVEVRVMSEETLTGQRTADLTRLPDVCRHRRRRPSRRGAGPGAGDRRRAAARPRRRKARRDQRLAAKARLADVERDMAHDG